MPYRKQLLLHLHSQEWKLFPPGLNMSVVPHPSSYVHAGAPCSVRGREVLPLLVSSSPVRCR